MLNLCNLCFEVSEFVPSPSTGDKFISFGGAREMLAPQIDIGGQSWCQKFVLSLCYLCFRVSQFVLSPSTPNIEKKFGGAGEVLAPPNRDRKSILVSKIFAQFVLFVLQGLTICAPSLHSQPNIEKKFGASKKFKKD